MAPRKKVARTPKSVEYIVDSDSEEEENDTRAACEPTEEDTEKRRRELERGDRGSKKYIGAHVAIKARTPKSVELVDSDSEEEENDTRAACEPTEEDTEKRRRELERGDRGSKKYIGAHIAIKDGIWTAVQACKDLGGRSFALFLGSQRTWKRPPLNPTAAAKFQEQCKLQGFDPAHILPHGSYLMNCGSPKLDVFTKSQALLIDELSRCHTLGLHLCNFHPGSSLGTITTRECVEKIAGAINHAHQQVPTVVTVIENMCGQGHTVGGKFSELRAIIDRVKDDTRVAVCLDTCHAFAAGYDLAAEHGVKTVLDEFDQTVGLRYLKALHLNDSKGALGCHLDRHEDIGEGKIGIAAFQDIINEPRLDNIPMILETPGRSGFEYPEQIKLLYSLCDTE